MPCSQLAVLEAELEGLEQLLEDQIERCQNAPRPRDQHIDCLQLEGIRDSVARKRQEVEECRTQRQFSFAEATGLVTFLRAHTQGGYGPPDDHLGSEVIFKLDSEPGLAFGLAPDDGAEAYRAQHDRMFDILRTAVEAEKQVRVEYLLYDDSRGKANHPALRIELLNPAGIDPFEAPEGRVIA